MDGSLDQVFLRASCEKLSQHTERIGVSVGKLSYEQIWARSGENSNSVGNLVLHLAGNVRQRIGSVIAGKPDIRDRAGEFAARSGLEPKELFERLEGVVAEAVKILRGLPATRLSEVVTVPGFQFTVLEAIYQVVEHFALHAGQIQFATKMLTGEDLGFYKHLNPPPKGQKP